jgi:hypothetical protein
MTQYSVGSTSVSLCWQWGQVIKEVSLRRPLFSWQESNKSKAIAGRIGRIEGEAKKEQTARSSRIGASYDLPL